MMVTLVVSLHILMGFMLVPIVFHWMFFHF